MLPPLFFQNSLANAQCPYMNIPPLGMQLMIQMAPSLQEMTLFGWDTIVICLVASGAQ